MARNLDLLTTSSAVLALQDLLGLRVSLNETEREHHSHGESYHTPGLPDAVCYPQSTHEVSEVMKISKRFGLPVVPFGAGTSLEGHVNAIFGGISVDLKNMNRILRISVEDMDATVEAGATRMQLVKALNNTGLTFFIDPGADATLGGMASTRASGTTAVRYGTMRENVLGLKVVLADGQIIETGTRARKSSAGYDLTRLFVGSEGTLGVLTEVTLRLHPIPEAVSVALCGFATVRDAVETVIEAIQLGTHLARVEFMDETMVDALNRFSHTNLEPIPTLLFEFHGMSARDVSEQAQTVEEIAQRHQARGFVWKAKLEEMEQLWEARHKAYFASRALRPGANVLSTDVCVPISALAHCIVETKSDLADVPFATTMVGHVGDGNFHVLCMLDERNPDELTAVKEFSDRLVSRALRFGGTCTGEHGVGMGKSKYLQREAGPAFEVMRSIKQTLDPDNRLNPGKIFAEE
jgi:D-lactate dehydrogenase (cytochrome)